MPIYDKNLKHLLLLNQLTDCLEIWYEALDTRVLSRLFNNDLGFTLTFFTARSSWENAKTHDSME